MEKIVLIGAGGHCKVVIDLIKDKYDIVGVTDTDVGRQCSSFYGTSIIGNDEKLRYIYMEGTKTALITVGSTGNSVLRQKLYIKALQIGFILANVFSDKAIISDSISVGNGNVVMDLAVIHADASIGSNCIINTGAIIEHDCKIGSHVHVAPGAKIAGGVNVGDGSHIGMGATVLQNIKIGCNCIVGAGAVVVRDLPENSVVVGIPAKPIKKDKVIQ